MVIELGNKTLSRQEDKRFPSGKFHYSWERNGPHRALPFLYLDSLALYAALSARLAFFALCYRAIAGFLPVWDLKKQSKDFDLPESSQGDEAGSRPIFL